MRNCFPVPEFSRVPFGITSEQLRHPASRGQRLLSPNKCVISRAREAAAKAKEERRGVETVTCRIAKLT